MAKSAKSVTDPAPDLAPEPMTAEQRLRAFEDKVFGPDHSRPAGKIEKGSGSIFQTLDDANKAHHAALEALVVAEAEHSAVAVTMAAAEDKLANAQHRAEETGGAL